MAPPTKEDLEKALTKIRAGWRAKILGPLAKTQEFEARDREAKGPIWVSRTVVPPPPEDDARQLLFRAIDGLAAPGDKVEYDAPAAASLRAEWLAPRKGVAADAAEPKLSEKEKFDAMSKEVGADSPVIFYMFGGNMTFGHPVAYRPFLRLLASTARARTFCVAYRLAPKHTFPSAILDIFISYLTLLSPPPGSHHGPIPARQIVLAGDSAGCGLSLALIQLILFAKRNSPDEHILFHGRRVKLELPAGFAGSSGYCDFTVSMPSERLFAQGDIFIQTLVNPVNAIERMEEPELNWPSTPPRHDYLCYQSALDHPLLSALSAQDWTGAPPMWIAMGDERPLDNMRVVAQLAHSQGVTVGFEWYRGLPHAFCQFLPRFAGSQLATKRWAEAIHAMTAGRFSSSTAKAVDVWTLAETPLDLGKMVSFPLSDVPLMMRMEKLSRQIVPKRSTHSHL